MATLSMTATATTAATPFASIQRAVRDSVLITKANVKHFLAQPGQIVGMIAMPIIFIVLFGYVFGSAIQIPGVGNYREYLMPGIFAQSAAFTMVAAAVGMAEMKEKGQMDRFRSLPMARSAVLVGQTFYQVLYTLVGTIVMVFCALATGWRIHTDVPHAAAGFGLLLLFVIATNFVGVCVGMVAKNATMADQIMMPITMPLTFLANTFISPDGLPSWLKPIADWNPLSATVAAMRELFGNAPSIVPVNQPWPLAHPVVASIGSSLILIAIALPLSIRLYRNQA
ncbi:MAG TPA: ABC transporter permease [Thermomicrobiales bacterium]|nr:ABC transporter permease [Thermomicrobiales bacterium]